MIPLNPEAPRTPREELEIQITALLMGQLPPEEAAELEAKMAADPELAALHARLRHAVHLLREARALPELPAAEARPQLSRERREKLLATFRGIKVVPSPAPGAVAATSTPTTRERKRGDRKWVPMVLAASIAVLLGGGAIYLSLPKFGEPLKSEALRSTSPATGFEDSDWSMRANQAEGASNGRFVTALGAGTSEDRAWAGSQYRTKGKGLGASVPPTVTLGEDTNRIVANSRRPATPLAMGRGNNDDAVHELEWKSQPGAIRGFDTTNSEAEARNKLYSAAEMDFAGGRVTAATSGISGRRATIISGEQVPVPAKMTDGLATTEKSAAASGVYLPSGTTKADGEGQPAPAETISGIVQNGDADGDAVRYTRDARVEGHTRGDGTKIKRQLEDNHTDTLADASGRPEMLGYLADRKAEGPSGPRQLQAATEGVKEDSMAIEGYQKLAKNNLATGQSGQELNRGAEKATAGGEPTVEHLSWTVDELFVDQIRPTGNLAKQSGAGEKSGKNTYTGATEITAGVLSTTAPSTPPARPPMEPQASESKTDRAGLGAAGGIVGRKPGGGGSPAEDLYGMRREDLFGRGEQAPEAAYEAARAQATWEVENEWRHPVRKSERSLSEARPGSEPVDLEKKGQPAATEGYATDAKTPTLAFWDDDETTKLNTNDFGEVTKWSERTARGINVPAKDAQPERESAARGLATAAGGFEGRGDRSQTAPTNSLSDADAPLAATTKAPRLGNLFIGGGAAETSPKVDPAEVVFQQGRQAVGGAPSIADNRSDSMGVNSSASGLAHGGETYADPDGWRNNAKGAIRIVPTTNYRTPTVLPKPGASGMAGQKYQVLPGNRPSAESTKARKDLALSDAGVDQFAIESKKKQGPVDEFDSIQGGAPLGNQPLTAGNRSGQLGISANAIDALLFDTPPATSPQDGARREDEKAPGIFSVTGAGTGPTFLRFGTPPANALQEGTRRPAVETPGVLPIDEITTAPAFQVVTPDGVKYFSRADGEVKEVEQKVFSEKADQKPGLSTLSSSAAHGFGYQSDKKDRTRATSATLGEGQPAQVSGRDPDNITASKLSRLTYQSKVSARPPEPAKKEKGEPEAAVQRELARRALREEAGEAALRLGGEALQKQDYESAFAHLDDAVKKIPAAPSAKPGREEAVKGLSLAGRRLAEQRVSEGYYGSAVQLLQEVLKHNPDDQQALKLIASIEAPDYFAKQLTPEARAKVEALKKDFIAKNSPPDTAKPATAPVVEPPAPVKAPEPPPVPQPEVSTKENAFSTFSLNVSDVSFKLAGASLEKGTLPEPATVRTEEFINALNYRDPEPAVGAPLGFVSERARYPFAQNRDLLRISVKTAAAGREPGRPLNLVLLLDNSGSMERADRVGILKESLRVLAAQLTPADKLSIITFARTPRLWADGVSGDHAAEYTQRVAEVTPQGGTDLSAAMNLGYETALKHYQVGSVNRVVLLTDGAANLGDVKPETLKEKVEVNRKQGVAFDCFGVGWEGYNDDLLEQLSRHGDGRYGFINTPEAAATEFAGQLAGALRVAASDVKVQVEFNPRRVSAYRQLGYAKHQLKKEQFRDNSVDAAELGAAESGNALYAIEVNPRGEGDIATVRVRFKVPGTSDYREHEWTVPYTAPALALEQAGSSLRLAATAAAFSEWLAQSPFAADVTPDRLLGFMNGLPAIYGADPRPAKLEWMIRQAKSISGR